MRFFDVFPDFLSVLLFPSYFLSFFSRWTFPKNKFPFFSFSFPFPSPLLEITSQIHENPSLPSLNKLNSFPNFPNLSHFLVSFKSFPLFPSPSPSFPPFFPPFFLFPSLFSLSLEKLPKWPEQYTPLFKWEFGVTHVRKFIYLFYIWQPRHIRIFLVKPGFY